MDRKTILLFGIIASLLLVILVCDGRPQTKKRFPLRWASKRFIRRKRPTRMPSFLEKQKHELDQLHKKASKVTLMSPLGEKHKDDHVNDYYKFNSLHNPPVIDEHKRRRRRVRRLSLTFKQQNTLE